MGGDMARVQGETIINRPVEEVLDFVADERNEPRYNPRMLDAEQVSEGPIGVGTRFGPSLRRWVDDADGGRVHRLRAAWRLRR